MLSRGINGAIVDWYGPDSPIENNATLLMKTEAESRNGDFVFAVTEDVGALSKCAHTPGCSVTQQLISDLTYIYNTYESSPAYMTVNGRPVVFFFAVDQYKIDWATVRNAADTLGNPYFVFNGSNSSLSHIDADGYFVWIAIGSGPTDESLGVLSKFYSLINGTSDLAYGGAYSGFNESLAPWVRSNPRVMNQNCGQTWLDTFNTVPNYYSPGHQLQALQIVTWNDYEEGTEIETGISNCIAISPSASIGSLNWTISGNENAVDHYTVFISLDGQNLMKLGDVPSGTHSFDFSNFNLSAGTSYQLFVKAVGLPSFLNVMSAAVQYSSGSTQGLPNAVLTVSANSGGVPLNITASTANSSSPNGPIVSSIIDFGDGSGAVSGPNAAHTYNAPGTFTVTGTVTDSAGETASTTQTIRVSAAVPTAVLNVTPTSGNSPLSVVASLANSSSPDATITSFNISFGDGTTASASTASHTYSAPGTFVVTGTVVDSLGASASATQNVTVTQPCSINGANRTVTICYPVANATVSSNLSIVAYAPDSRSVTQWAIYIDSTLVYLQHTSAKSISVPVTMSAGSHNIQVTAWDSIGHFGKAITARVQ
jgi:PKD repeat protein